MILLLTLNARIQTVWDGRHQFIHRKERIARYISSQKPDLIGFQELTRDMRSALMDRLPEYGFLGRFARPGERGECTAIAYRLSTLSPRESETFWLSDTPEREGSRFLLQSPDARTCTWAEFSCKESGARFRYFNAHLDHISQYARAKSISLIRSRIIALSRKESLPFFWGGDFNFTPRNPLYAECLGKKAGALLLTDLSREIVSTFHWYGATQRPLKIDYLLAGNTARGDRFRTYAVMTDDQMRYLSDHYALLVEWMPAT